MAQLVDISVSVFLSNSLESMCSDPIQGNFKCLNLAYSFILEFTDAQGVLHHVSQGPRTIKMVGDYVDKLRKDEPAHYSRILSLASTKLAESAASEDAAFQVQAEKAIASMETASGFMVPNGQLTFDSEGNEGGTFHSRTPHVPSSVSGVTLGRGYDMKEKPGSQIVSDLMAAGLSQTSASAYSPASTLFGPAAETFIAQNQLEEISPAQQMQLFAISYKEKLDLVQSISSKPDVVQTYGAVNFLTLDPRIIDVVVDLAYRGDYTPATRQFLQPTMVQNDFNAFKEAMSKQSNWTNVPSDRFARRVGFLENSSF